MSREKHLQRHPGFPFLDSTRVDLVESLLRRLNLLPPGTTVTSLARAGEGNMNLTLRATLSDGSTRIVKQSRPWVEKYDQIDAPFDRSLVEAAFYRAVATENAVAGAMPRLLGDEPASRTLVLADLGAAADFTPVYSNATIADAEINSLAHWLAALHAMRVEPGELLANRAMRELNHQHIHEIPLMETPLLDLDGIEPGLAAAAKLLREDAGYRARVANAAARYLADGPTLVHGDFFPGSWIRTAAGVFVIDPEFGHLGFAEFDVGVALAHFALAGVSQASAERFVRAYARPLNEQHLAENAGVEVMRRLIGVAQLPIPRDGRRAALLERSRRCVKGGNWRLLWH